MVSFSGVDKEYESQRNYNKRHYPVSKQDKKLLPHLNKIMKTY